MHELDMANADPEQQREIVTFAANNLAMKEKRPDIYSSLSKEASAYLLCASLKKVIGNNLSPELEQFLSTGSLRNNGQIDELKALYSRTLNH